MVASVHTFCWRNSVCPSQKTILAPPLCHLPTPGRSSKGTVWENDVKEVGVGRGVLGIESEKKAGIAVAHREHFGRGFDGSFSFNGRKMGPLSPHFMSPPRPTLSGGALRRMAPR